MAIQTSSSSKRHALGHLGTCKDMYSEPSLSLCNS
ncbi:hypothetical protein L3X38_000351, partial [Prunus dulcis]